MGAEPARTGVSTEARVRVVCKIFNIKREPVGDNAPGGNKKDKQTKAPEGHLVHSNSPVNSLAQISIRKCHIVASPPFEARLRDTSTIAVRNAQKPVVSVDNA